MIRLKLFYIILFLFTLKGYAEYRIPAECSELIKHSIAMKTGKRLEKPIDIDKKGKIKVPLLALKSNVRKSENTGSKFELQYLESDENDVDYWQSIRIEPIKDSPNEFRIVYFKNSKFNVENQKSSLSIDQKLEFQTFRMQAEHPESKCYLMKSGTISTDSKKSTEFVDYDRKVCFDIYHNNYGVDFEQVANALRVVERTSFRLPMKKSANTNENVQNINCDNDFEESQLTTVRKFIDSCIKNSKEYSDNLKTPVHEGFERSEQNYIESKKKQNATK